MPSSPSLHQARSTSAPKRQTGQSHLGTLPVTPTHRPCIQLDRSAEGSLHWRLLDIPRPRRQVDLLVQRQLADQLDGFLVSLGPFILALCPGRGIKRRGVSQVVLLQALDGLNESVGGALHTWCALTAAAAKATASSHASFMVMVKENAGWRKEEGGGREGGREGDK